MARTMEHPSYRGIAQAIRRRSAWASGETIRFPSEGADVHFLPFHSRGSGHLLGHDGYACPVHGLRFPAEPTDDGPTDHAIAENVDFRYPLLRDQGAERARELVVILHGLNERSFTKYVPWAYQLWRATGAAVALFPLPFHVNRVLPAWGRQLDVHLARRRAVPRNENVHAFNCVVSERLDAFPERLFWGGLQGLRDVVDLVREVRSGRHPHVHPDARVDLVGYSIGGYLALALLLLDEDGLFGDTRAVVFESGAALRATNMSSRFIIDHACEVSLMKLYVRFTGRLANPRLAHWLRHHEEGRWFRALCGDESERPALEARLRELSPRLLGLTNRNDEVIPAPAILNTLQGLHRDTGVRIEELALGVHEHPFLCPDYAQRDRRFVTEFLDEPRYGAGFARFIEATTGMLRPGAAP
jgi:pimeloyl-ACP methyl ester carboxylesterase